MTKFDIIGQYQKKQGRISTPFQEFTFQEIASFQQAIYEVHDLAQQRFIKTHAPEDAEIILDTLVAIRDMEERKRYLPIEELKSMSK